jgi:hypothetical protein
MAYFKQLTGSKSPKPVAKKFKVGDNKFEYGVIYKIKTDKGYFTLRNSNCLVPLTSVFIKHTIRSK